jgi:hypothetical protein
MGRPSKLTDAQWEMIGKRLLVVKDSEAAAIEMVRLMLQFGDLETAWSLPKIDRHRFEFPVKGGRIDLLLFHADGGVTIVEAKADRGLSDVAAGIGQLCVYATLLQDALGKAFVPVYIRRVLAAPLSPDASVTMMSACRLAGVEFAHLPTYAEFQTIIAPLRDRVA